MMYLEFNGKKKVYARQDTGAGKASKVSAFPPHEPIA